MTNEFEGKTAIVTGAASGIGAAIARALAGAGARVVCADIDADDVERIAKEIGGIPAIADISDGDAVQALVKRAEDETGAVHLMVNNAGIGGAQAPVGEYPVDSWEKVIAINLTGVFLGLRYGIPAIQRAGGGAIVNMASILGAVGTQGSCAYVAAKHGVVGLTKAAALEYATKGIRVNAIGPGYIDTPLLSANLDDDQLKGIAALHPMQRLGTDTEVADLTLFLLSDRASFITGSYHLVDGGYTAQ